MDVSHEDKIKNWFKEVANLTIILFLAVLVVLIIQMIFKSSSILPLILSMTIFIIITVYFIYIITKGIKLIKNWTPKRWVNSREISPVKYLENTLYIIIALGLAIIFLLNSFLFTIANSTEQYKAIFDMVMPYIVIFVIMIFLIWIFFNKIFPKYINSYLKYFSTDPEETFDILRTRFKESDIDFKSKKYSHSKLLQQTGYFKMQNRHISINLQETQGYSKIVILYRAGEEKRVEQLKKSIDRVLS